MNKKSFLLTEFLCFFFGFFGVHRFYTGYKLIGTAQLLTLGGLGFWQIIDFLAIFSGKYKDSNGESLDNYNFKKGVFALIIYFIISLPFFIKLQNILNEFFYELLGDLI